MTNPGYTYLKEYRERRTAERYVRAVELLGGKCVKCGITEGLEFDHIDRLTKSYDIATHLWDYSWERLLLELAKCQPMCRPCHWEKSLQELGMTAARGTHGTVSAYRYCGPPKYELCKQAKRNTPSYRKRFKNA